MAVSVGNDRIAAEIPAGLGVDDGKSFHYICRIAMKIYFFIRAYNAYGGGSVVYSPICDLLELRLGNYGEAIQTFDWLAYLRSATYIQYHTMEGLYRQHHEYLAKLPKLVFQAQSQAIQD